MIEICECCAAAVKSEYCEYCGNRHKNYSPNQNVTINNYNTQNNNTQNNDMIRKLSYNNPTEPIQKCSNKNRIVALVLCVLFGYFGVHRFYVGKIGSGLFYTFTAGGFYIGWIIDIFLIASGNFTDSNGFKIK